MPCYNPMLAVPRGLTKDGKIYYTFREKFIDASQLSEVIEMPDGRLAQVKALPCGKCIGCRLDYSREWAVRCMLEMKDYAKDECFFVTLTYDDLHVPAVFYTEDSKYENGEILGTQNVDDSEQTSTFVQPNVIKNQTLVPKHLQDFIKLLRRSQDYNYGKKLRFYACGEYGSKSMRPHYHILIFGVHLPEPASDAWRKQLTGYSVYEDKYLESIWKRGNVIVGSCTFESVEYVARYMLKKQKGDDRFFYMFNHIVPPFTRMSLRPGIGLKYYDEHKEEMYKLDELFLETEKKGLKVKPPLYFDRKFMEEFPDLYDQIKVERSNASVLSMLAQEEASGLPMSQILRNKEEIRKFKTAILQERNKQ